MYYVYERPTSDSDELFLVDSSLGGVLTTRLLQYASGDSSFGHGRVFGVIDDITWFGADVPSRVVPLSHFIEPRLFTNDKEVLYWSLLSEADAKALHKYWCDDSKYKEEPLPGKHNYFKNTVDSFKHAMRTKWFKQVK